MFIEMLRRLAWRLRRFGLLRLASPRGPAVDAIERFTVFDGQLHIAGKLDTDAPVRDLALHLPGGECVAVPFEPAGPAAIRFDQRMPVPGDPAEIASVTLVCVLETGSTVRLEHLGAPIGDPAHTLTGQFRAMLAEARPGALLEVGSRARSGIARRDWAPPGWSYSGFDIVGGSNVDVVGDAHVLSRHYKAEQFDAVMAFSALEHLLMPWKFVIELNRVLKPGAFGLFTTHQCWPIHDAPWDFWRFSDTAWTSLLNPATGFEIIAARLGEPAYVVAQRCSPTTAFAQHPDAYLASFVLFRKIGATTLAWPVELADIIDTGYPDHSAARRASAAKNWFDGRARPRWSRSVGPS